MEFTHEFEVAADADRTFEALVDLARVAPCMPGATLGEVNGHVHSGLMRVKLGPVKLTYAGEAEVVDVDSTSRTATIRAGGREQRGAGAAEAKVSARVRADGDRAVVTVVSSIQVTGRAAQFGRGVMEDVGARIVAQFADCLAELLAQPPVTDVAAASPARPTEAVRKVRVGGPVEPVTQPPGRDILDLGAMVGPAAMRRALPIVALLAVAAIVWRLARG